MRGEGNMAVEGIIYDKLPMNKKVLDIVFFMMSGGKLPPIKLQETPNGWKLKDGRHRLAAHKLLDKEFILAKYFNKDLIFNNQYSIIN